MVGKHIPVLDGETREKIRKDLKRRLGTYVNGEDKMTLIIGARCKDGVVFIADKKAVEGTEITSQKKISILPLGIVVAGAGTMEMTDKFNERVPFILEERRQLNFEEIQKKDSSITLENTPYYFRPYEFLEDCEGLIFNLHEKYKLPTEILIGAKVDGIAELHALDTNDFTDSKRRTYKSIGSGSPYANFLLKKMWDKNLTIEEMAKIGKFIVRYVAQSKLDNYVGEDIQIVFILDFPTDFDKLNEEEQKKYFVYEKQFSSISTANDEAIEEGTEMDWTENKDKLSEKFGDYLSETAFMASFTAFLQELKTKIISKRKND